VGIRYEEVIHATSEELKILINNNSKKTIVILCVIRAFFTYDCRLINSLLM